jgi:hypothetical protein
MRLTGQRLDAFAKTLDPVFEIDYGNPLRAKAVLTLCSTCSRDISAPATSAGNFWEAEAVDPAG